MNSRVYGLRVSGFRSRGPALQVWCLGVIGAEPAIAESKQIKLQTYDSLVSRMLSKQGFCNKGPEGPPAIVEESHSGLMTESKSSKND